MVNFPINTGPKEDHPERVQKLIGVDPKYYYKAEELKLYEDSINELASRTAGTSPQPNELIEKGFHHIENFDWHVFAQEYRRNGVLYEAPEDLIIDKVTIDPAPTTVDFKRFDVVVFNDDFTFSKVKGDEGLNPAIPKIDIRTQIQLTVILVEYGTTEPSYLTKQLMYDEGVGLPAEFAVTKTGANITINDTTQFSSGANCIKVVNPVASNVLFLDKNVTFNSLDIDTISFKIKNGQKSNASFYLYSYNSIGAFYQGTTEIKNGKYGYDSQNITDWQIIIVPRSKILGGSEIHNTGWALTFKPTTGTYYFDEFAMNGNFTQAPITSEIAEAPIDDDYYVRRNAGWFGIGTLMTAWNNAVSWITTNGATLLSNSHAPGSDNQTGAEIKALYEAEANTNAYTDSEKAKLGSIDATHYLPPLQTTVQLSALAQASLTDKARVYVEDELSDYFYDATAVSGSIAPNDQVGGIGFWRVVAVGGETAASIKTKYESNADTNAFTDAEKTAVATNSAKVGFTAAGVLATILSGLSIITGGDVVATDTVIQAFGKLQKQISDLITTVNGKQATLVSGTNIRTINGNTLLGSTDLVISGGAGGGARVYNVKDYGALGNGVADDTVAIQTTIQTVFNAGGGVVYFPNGIYLINGALDSASNSQIYFPLNSYTSSINLKTIKLLGETPPNQFSNPFTVSGSNDVSNNGVILKSNLLSAGNIIGSRSEAVNWGNYNFLSVKIENISIRYRSMTSTTNVQPLATSINMGNVAGFTAKYFEVMPTSKMNELLEPASSCIGVVMPKQNNFTFSSCSDFLIYGCFTAVSCYEHTHLDKFIVDICVNGLVFNASNHSIHITKGIIARSRYNIRAEPGSYFYVDHVSFEDDYYKVISSPTWNATLYDLNDVSSNTAKGLIRFHNVRPNFGPDYSITKRSATNPSIKFIKINELIEFEFITGPYSPPSAYLLAYWKFDETTGNYNDLSINARTAIRVNGATSGAGVIGNAMLTANASNQHANAGQVGLSYANNALTFCGWFKINTTTQAYQTLFNKGDATGREYNLFYTKSTNRITFQFFNGTVFKGMVYKTITVGQWFFVCAELIGTTLSLSVNNGAPSTATVTGVSTEIAKDFLIGASGVVGENLDGGIDELSVWNRVLNVNEKAYLYNEGAGNSITI